MCINERYTLFVGVDVQLRTIFELHLNQMITQTENQSVFLLGPFFYVNDSLIFLDARL